MMVWEMTTRDGSNLAHWIEVRYQPYGGLFHHEKMALTKWEPSKSNLRAYFKKNQEFDMKSDGLTIAVYEGKPYICPNYSPGSRVFFPLETPNIPLFVARHLRIAKKPVATKYIATPIGEIYLGKEIFAAGAAGTELIGDIIYFLEMETKIIAWCFAPQSHAAGPYTYQAKPVEIRYYGEVDEWKQRLKRQK